MRAEIYWVPECRIGQLAVMHKPRGGDWLEDEIRSLRNQRVNAIVSLLTANEVAELGLVDESVYCQDNQIEYISFPIADREVPTSAAATTQLVQNIDSLLRQGKGVAIHCRAGIGRSALIAAFVLVRQGLSTADAFKAIEKARGTPVPDTDEQRDWVVHFSDDQMTATEDH